MVGRPRGRGDGRVSDFPAYPSTRYSPLRDSDNCINWDRLSLVHAALQSGPLTTKQLAETTGLTRRKAVGRVGFLRELGHRVYIETHHNARVYHYLRPPGRGTCPDCGHVLRSTQPHWICDCCKDKRIEAGREIWPSVEGEG
jgi:hypothetical protein